MKALLPISLIAILSACAAATPQEARNLGPEHRYSFEVAADYQTVYRRIVEVERDCYQGNMLTASMVVNADLYPDTRSGTISVGMYGMATSIYQVIDVRAIDSDHSEVRAVFPTGSAEGWGKKVEAWANGTAKNC